MANHVQFPNRRRSRPIRVTSYRTTTWSISTSLPAPPFPSWLAPSQPWRSDSRPTLAPSAPPRLVRLFHLSAVDVAVALGDSPLRQGSLGGTGRPGVRRHHYRRLRPRHARLREAGQIGRWNPLE